MSLIDRLPLTNSDYDAFERLGIPREIVDAADVFRVDDHEGARMVGRSHLLNAWHRYSGIIYPIRWPGDNTILDYRLRRDFPDEEMQPHGEIKETGKYMNSPGAKSRLYFPPGVDPVWLEDATIPIVIVEGEKKCLALWVLAWYGVSGDRPRFLPIALPGVWNWRKSVKANGRTVSSWIDDLNNIAWDGRTVKILFDSNVHWNESVKVARVKLAYLLSEWKANVLFADLPNDPTINGIDDYLGIHGPIKAQALIDKANKATWPECKESQEYFALSNWAQMDDVANLLFAHWQLSPESVQLFRAINSTWGGRPTKEFRLSHETAYKRMARLPEDAGVSDKKKARRLVHDRLEIFECELASKLTIKLIEVVERGGKFDPEKEIRLNTLYRVRHSPFLAVRRLAKRIVEDGKYEGEKVTTLGKAREIAARVVGDHYLLANAKDEVKAERQAQLEKRAKMQKTTAAKDSKALTVQLEKYVGKTTEAIYQTLYDEDHQHLEILPIVEGIAHRLAVLMLETCKKKSRTVRRQIEQTRKLEGAIADRVGTAERTHSEENPTPVERTHSDAGINVDSSESSISLHIKEYADISESLPNETADAFINAQCDEVDTMLAANPEAFARLSPNDTKPASVAVSLTGIQHTPEQRAAFVRRDWREILNCQWHMLAHGASRALRDLSELPPDPGGFADEYNRLLAALAARNGKPNDWRGWVVWKAPAGDATFYLTDWWPGDEPHAQGICPALPGPGGIPASALDFSPDALAFIGHTPDAPPPIVPVTEPEQAEVFGW